MKPRQSECAARPGGATTGELIETPAIRPGCFVAWRLSQICADPPEPLHRPLSSPERQVAVLHPTYAMAIDILS
jgi:hypothetical protein